MLVLARQEQEKIVIGEDGQIEIVVVRIDGDKVRLGIAAPRHVIIDREEIHREKLAARQRPADGNQTG